MNTALFPILGYALTSTTKSEAELWELAEYTLMPELVRIPGVSEVQVQGGRRREFQVHLDLEALAARKLAVSDVLAAIKKNNQVLSAGLTESNHELYLALVDGVVTDTAGLSRIAVPVPGGGVPALLGDLAVVRVADAISYIRTTADGRPAVLINLTRQPSANTVAIASRGAPPLRRAAGPAAQGRALDDFLRPGGVRLPFRQRRPRRDPHRRRAGGPGAAGVPAQCPDRSGCRRDDPGHRRRRPAGSRHHGPDDQPHDPRGHRGRARPDRRRRHRRRGKHSAPPRGRLHRADDHGTARHPPAPDRIEPFHDRDLPALRPADRSRRGLLQAAGPHDGGRSRHLVLRLGPGGSRRPACDRRRVRAGRGPQCAPGAEALPRLARRTGRARLHRVDRGKHPALPAPRIRLSPRDGRGLDHPRLLDSPGHVADRHRRHAQRAREGPVDDPRHSHLLAPHRHATRLLHHGAEQRRLRHPPEAPAGAPGRRGRDRRHPRARGRDRAGPPHGFRAAARGQHRRPDRRRPAADRHPHLRREPGAAPGPRPRGRAHPGRREGRRGHFRRHRHRGPGAHRPRAGRRRALGRGRAAQRGALRPHDRGRAGGRGTGGGRRPRRQHPHRRTPLRPAAVRARPARATEPAPAHPERRARPAFGRRVDFHRARPRPRSTGRT